MIPKENNMFFDVIKKWTALDYYTQGIKAEVIIDMLISEYIEEILSSCLGEKVHLIAKEFPIPTFSQKNDSRNAKVDYLCYSDNKNKDGVILYLVELKTTSSSIEYEQMLKYFCIANEMKEQTKEMQVDDREADDFEKIQKDYKRLAGIESYDIEHNTEKNRKIETYIKKAQMFAGSRYPLWDWSVQNMYRIFYNELRSKEAIKTVLGKSKNENPQFIDQLTDSQKYFTLLVRLLVKEKEHSSDIHSFTKTLVDILCISKQRYTSNARNKLNCWLNEMENKHEKGEGDENKIEKDIYNKVMTERENYEELMQIHHWLEENHIFNSPKAMLSCPKPYPFSEKVKESRIIGQDISKIQIVYLAPVLSEKNLTKEKELAEELCIKSRENKSENGISEKLFQLITYEEIQKIGVKKGSELKNILDILKYIHSYQLAEFFKDIEVNKS